MPAPGSEHGHPSDQQAWFATTHWSVVLAARDQGSPQAAAALQKLCRTYWYPLYAYVRRRGYGEQDAQDLAQGFFARLVQRNYLEAVGRQRSNRRLPVNPKRQTASSISFPLDSDALLNRAGKQIED